MSKDYSNTLDRLAPGSANPEVAVNDALTQVEAGLTEVAANASGLPAGGVKGEFLGYGDSGPAWAGVPAELPTGGSVGQILVRTANGVAWEDAPSDGSGGGGGDAAKPFFASGTFEYDGGTLVFSDLKNCTVTRLQAGLYRVNFNNNAADSHYGILVSGKWGGSVSGSHSMPNIGIDRDTNNNVTIGGFGIMESSVQYDIRCSFVCFANAAAVAA